MVGPCWMDSKDLAALLGLTEKQGANLCRETLSEHPTERLIWDARSILEEKGFLDPASNEFRHPDWVSRMEALERPEVRDSMLDGWIFHKTLRSIRIQLGAGRRRVFFRRDQLEEKIAGNRENKGKKRRPKTLECPECFSDNTKEMTGVGFGDAKRYHCLKCNAWWTVRFRDGTYGGGTCFSRTRVPIRPGKNALSGKTENCPTCSSKIPSPAPEVCPECFAALVKEKV